MKRKSKSLRRYGFLGLAGVAAIVGLSGGAGWLWWTGAIAPVQGNRDQTERSQTQVQIPAGTSAQQVGVILKQAGVIRSLDAWKLWTRWSLFQEPSKGFQAGTYQLSPQDSLPQVAEAIWSGAVEQTSFTIPEGWSLKQMAQYFEQKGWFTADEFLQVARTPDRERFPWLPADLPFLEGYLFPDTYQIPLDQRTAAATVNVMLQQFERLALPIYTEHQGADKPSLNEWVTLASIVEEESVVDDERTEIAGVFWNRLQEGITLGADPTVEYGLGLTQTPDRPLTFAEVKRPSPYNTYINPGLPPTPISSPGLASLKATLNPATTENLFFVARYDGTHVFSRTLAEHERATAMIRRQRRAQ